MGNEKWNLGEPNPTWNELLVMLQIIMILTPSTNFVAFKGHRRHGKCTQQMQKYERTLVDQCS